MKVDIGALKSRYLKKTRVDIADAEEMRVVIPVLLREVDRLEKKVSELETRICRIGETLAVPEREGAYKKAVWRARYDVSRNRLYIRLEGIFNARSAKMLSNAVVSLIDFTQRDYDIINDVTQLEAVADLRVLFHLKKVRFHLNASGVRRIVRVINKDNKVISALFAKGGSELVGNIFITESLEEAEAILDNPELPVKI